MPSISVVRESVVSKSARARQLESIFDVPPTDTARLTWEANLPFEADDWRIGLIVGASGCGKSTIARELWPSEIDQAPSMEWSGDSVLDDFADELSMDDISAACMAVGFNTIPAWLRPFSTLSNGEQFRVTLARALLESGDVCVFDEFTSVVDRQVAQIACHAAQKFIRRREDKKLVAVTCHYDVEDWLQPDWIYDPSADEFRRRLVRRRPQLDFAVSPIPYDAWRVFAPFHYMTAKLHRGARCWGLYVGERLAAFCGVLYRPHPRRKNVFGVSRLVTLPDFQGLGCAFMLVDRVAALYRSRGQDLRTYPAHPALIRSFDRSKVWSLRRKPGTWSTRAQATNREALEFGGRPCAVFEYVGEPWENSSEVDDAFAYWS